MAEARKPTQRYLSGRVKIAGTEALADDRHLYVEPGQVEPNLGYVGERDIPISDKYYNLITIPNGGTGDRYWQEISGLEPGGITVFDESIQVSTANSITKLDFIGVAVTATASGSISTITISNNAQVSVGTEPPADALNGDLWWHSGVGELFVLYDDEIGTPSAQWVETSGGSETVTISETPPPGANPGDLWFDSVRGRLLIYYEDPDSSSSQWIDANAGLLDNIRSFWVQNSTGIHTIGNVGIGTTNAIGIASNTNTSILNAGIVTAVTYFGDGSNLTGITATGGPGGKWVQNSSGIHTLSAVGVGTTNPLSPVHPDNNTIFHAGIVTANEYYGDGSNLTGVGGTVGIGTTAPVDPDAGDLWWNSGNGKLAVFYDDHDGSPSSQWVQVSEGPMGRQGAQGVQGAAGTGSQGVQGNQGHQGVQGAPGTGNQGVQGALGAQGNQGHQGVQGTPGAGNQGVQGNQGHQGVQGAEGTGNQGVQGALGAQGNQGHQGVQGTAGTQGNQGHQGVQGAQGSQGHQGTAGTQGNQGHQGVQGAQGSQGHQGVQGANGNFGGATFDYTFSTSTGVPSDLLTGRLRFNNSNLTSATIMWLDDEDDNGTDIQAFLRTIDDSTSTIKGHFRVSKKSDAEAFVLFTITSASEESGFHQVNGSHISGSGTAPFSNGEDIIVTFARTGDRGDAGAQGNQGHQGVQGADGNGVQGFQGVQGAAGAQGNQGHQGVQGAAGQQGNQGHQGVQGAVGAQGAQGAAGAQGNQGHQGVQGAAGAQGNQGRQGALGAQGNQGHQGVQGAAGAQGAQGAAGAQGAQGAAGNPGAQGAQGAAGPQGHQGRQGAAGAQGAQGATGNGPPGAQGNQGHQGRQGATGNGSPGAQGAQGAPGSPGAQGAQGAPGTAGPGNSITVSATTDSTCFPILAGSSGAGAKTPLVGDQFTFDESNGNFTATGNVTAFSDSVLKEDIEIIENALEKICSVRGITFTRKDTGVKGTGVIAQEIEQILPEAVFEVGSDPRYKTVAYGNLIGLVIEAIKELKSEIDELGGKK